MTARSAGTTGEAPLGDPRDAVDELLNRLEARLPRAVPGTGRDPRHASMATGAPEPVIVIEPGY